MLLATTSIMVWCERRPLMPENRERSMPYLLRFVKGGVRAGMTGAHRALRKYCRSPAGAPERRSTGIRVNQAAGGVAFGVAVTLVTSPRVRVSAPTERLGIPPLIVT